MAELNCCNTCVTILLVVINILYLDQLESCQYAHFSITFHCASSLQLLIGIFLTCLGMFFLIVERYLNVVVGSSMFTPAAVIILVVGIVTVIMAIIGMIGACADLCALLIIYCFLLIGIICVQVLGGIWIFDQTADVEQKVSKQLMNCLQSYTTTNNASYNGVKNDVIDFVQDRFHCCGINGPTDWLTHNPKYFLSNGVPNSCICHSGSSNDCYNLSPLKYSVWKKGCNEKVHNEIDNIMTGFADSLLVLSGFQVLTLVLSIGFCCCIRSSRSDQRRARVVGYMPPSTIYNNRSNYTPPYNYGSNDMPPYNYGSNNMPPSTTYNYGSNDAVATRL